MTKEEFRKYLAAIELMDEFNKLSATEVMELQMSLNIVQYVESIGGVDVLKERLSCLYENCCDSVRKRSGRQSYRKIVLINELGLQ